MRFKYGTYEDFQFGDLEDMVFTKIEYKTDLGDEIHFYTDTEHFVLHHAQDCCEDVHIESITGDLQDLVGSPVTMAELVTENNHNTEVKYGDYNTWSFYKLASERGYVDIRWIGSSNGYYSEEVDFVRLK